MVARFVFHIGTPKSGTTFIQSVLLSNHASLLEAGVLVPGAGGLNRTRMRTEIVAGLDRLDDSLTNRMLDQAAAHPGTVLLSEEWLVRAGSEAVATLLDACGPVPVEVVVTTRDFTRLVPAAWQEVLKLGHGYDLDQFVARLERPRARWSWSTLDPHLAVRAWADLVPADRVHVVVAPATGGDPTVLWHRFCQAAGIPAGAAVLNQTSTNETLGVLAARLMQEIGPSLASAVLREDDDNRARYRWLQRYVSHDVLRTLPRQPIALRPQDHAAVRERAAATARSIELAGWTLVGEPQDLMGPPEPQGRHPSSVTATELLAVAGPVMGRILSDLRVAREEADRAEADVDRPQA